MPRGKKFDAAEKHFLKKEAGYLKSIKELKEALAAAAAEVAGKENQLQEVRAENELLKKEIEQLRKTAGLSPEEVSKLVRGAEGAATLCGFIQSSRGGAFGLC